MSKLVIVESPAKAKTIKKYLGRGYEVVASMGHIRDLPKTKMGIDIENNFEPKYINIKGKGDLIKSLKKSAKGKKKIYLATDPDREGEAISWHLSYILNLDLEDKNRVTFNEITKSGVKQGMSNPRKLDIDLINAQQTRRILDRIVGYKLSPFLWKKVRGGLSAGRVQSVTVKLIVEREIEIRNFKPEEYWSIDAKLKSSSSKKAFASKFYGIDGKKVEIKSKYQADEILSLIKNNDFIVDKVKVGSRRKPPPPPFITSTLQQEASKKLNFQSKRTMKVAQELYEGVDIKSIGAIGLITYMRTDSLRISNEAKESTKKFIIDNYNEQYISKVDRVYKKKGNQQDGHEAIRPTMPELIPEKIKDSLTSDQYKLYRLIWCRFIASQMSDCLLETISVDIKAGNCIFKSSGYNVKFDGYTVIYEESKDDDNEKQSKLPSLEKDEILNVESIDPNQHFTQPPPRYTEASLIKFLEENGIGRPSTYAPTITTVINRTYVEREAKQLKPTVLGEITTDLMKNYFSNIVNIEFTANMEENLDLIEFGKKDWHQILNEFYCEFSKTLENAENILGEAKFEVPDEETDEICENCGRNMVVKMGRFGKFLACPNYPECKYTKNIVKYTDGICPICDNRIVEKKSKSGKKYYGCEKNPQCKFMTWDQPIKDKCPKCGKSLLKKLGKSSKIYCSNDTCEYERGIKD